MKVDVKKILRMTFALVSIVPVAGLGIHLSFALLVGGYMEIMVAKTCSATEHYSLPLQDVLFIVSSGTLMMGLGTVLLQTTVIFLFYFVPKAERWVEKRT